MKSELIEEIRWCASITAVELAALVLIVLSAIRSEGKSTRALIRATSDEQAKLAATQIELEKQEVTLLRMRGKE